MYALVELTQVCQFWRTALINNPQTWTTIFASLDDRRSFVEICLERSGSAPLDVTMDVCDGYKPHPLCTCDKDKRSRITPNEVNPCEWHFLYESFAETRHSKRIRTLNIRLVDNLPDTERAMLALGYCRFFNLPPLELVTLDWNNLRTTYADYLFSIPPFSPTLRSLSFEGSWQGRLPNVNNLVSLTLCGRFEEIGPETFRKLMMNNSSLETLGLNWVGFTGRSGGVPVELSNLKSFAVISPPRNLSTLIRVPALRRLYSLRILVEEDYMPMFEFCATGDGIVFTTHSGLPAFTETWQDLTGYDSSSILHVRLENPKEIDVDEDVGTHS